MTNVEPKKMDISTLESKLNNYRRDLSDELDEEINSPPLVKLREGVYAIKKQLRELKAVFSGDVDFFRNRLKEVPFAMAYSHLDDIFKDFSPAKETITPEALYKFMESPAVRNDEPSGLFISYLINNYLPEGEVTITKPIPLVGTFLGEGKTVRVHLNKSDESPRGLFTAIKGGTGIIDAAGTYSGDLLAAYGLSGKVMVEGDYSGDCLAYHLLGAKVYVNSVKGRNKEERISVAEEMRKGQLIVRQDIINADVGLGASGGEIYAEKITNSSLYAAKNFKVHLNQSLRDGHEVNIPHLELGEALKGTGLTTLKAKNIYLNGHPLNLIGTLYFRLFH